MSRRAAVSGLLRLVLPLVLASGCEPQGVSLRWDVDLAPEVRDRTVRMETWIARGSCAEQGEVLHRFELGEGSDGAGRVVLEPGAYVFAARALDADCRWFAAGCEAVQLPLDDDATVVVPVGLTDAEEDACDGLSCDAGRCVGTEPDGGMDGGMDGGTDAGRDAGVDGGGGPCGAIHGSDTTMPICRASDTVEVDGVFDEYAMAVPVRVTAGAAMGTFRALWDCDGLYVAMEATDTQLFATATERDSDELWRTDSAEIMLDTNHDATTSDVETDDYHVMFGVTGALRDARGDGSFYLGSYDLPDYTLFTDFDGTLDDAEPDVGWTAELALGWSSLGIADCPAPGRTMGADMALNDETRSGADRMHDTADWAGLTIYANPAAWNEILLLDASGDL